MKLYTPDGKQVDVPDDQAADALASGQYGLPKGTKIPWSVGGQPGTLDFDPETFPQAVQLGGKVVSPDVVAKAQKDAYLQENYGGPGDAAAAAALGFADTASLGAVPFVAGQLGGKDVRRYMRNVEEANPTASAVGSVAGVAAPIAADIVTGGAATPEVAPALARTGAKLGLGVDAARLAEAGASAAPKLAEGAEAASALRAAPEALPAAGDALKTVASPQAALMPEAESLRTAAQSPMGSALRTEVSVPADVVPTIKPGARAVQAAEDVAKAASTSGAVEDQGVRAAAAAAKAGVEEAVPVAKAVSQAAVEQAAAAEPGLFSQGAGAFGRAVTAPTRFVSEVGSIVEREVAKLVGTEAESVLGRVAQRTVQLGARGAAEGALYEAGAELGRESKQDSPDFTAQKFLSAMWRGAKFGGPTAGGLGAAGSLIGEGVRRAAPGLLEKANSLMFSALDKSGGLERDFTAKFGADGANALREQLIDSGVMKAGSRIDEMAPKLADQAAIAREKYLDLLQASNAGLEGLPVAAAERALRKEFPKSRLPSLENSQDVVGKLTADLQAQAVDGVIPFDRAAVLVRDLDGLMASGSVDKKAASALQNVLMDHLDQSFSKAIDVESGDFGGFASFLEGLADVQKDKIREVAGRYRQLSLASRYADESAAAYRSGVERTAKQMAEPGLVGLPKGLEKVGAVLAAGHLLGHGIGAGVAGFAAKTAKKIVQERGASAAAVALDEVALRAGAREAGDQVQRRIDRAVGSVFSKAAEGEYGTIPEPMSRLSYEERVNRLLRAAETAEQSTDRIKAEVQRAGLRDERLSQSLRQGYLRSVTYLLNELPKPPQDPGSLQPDLQHKDWEPSEGDKMDWSRKYDVVTHPEHYVRRIADGTVTPSETKAMLATHPEIHDYVVQSLKKKAAQSKKLVLPTTEASIRRAEGVPLISPATRSAFTRVDRELGQAGRQGGGGGRSGGPLKIDVGARGLTGRGKASKY